MREAHVAARANDEVADGVPLYVEDDVASMADAFDRACSGLADERLAAGRARAAVYDWDATAAATVDVYRSLEPFQRR